MVVLVTDEIIVESCCVKMCPQSNILKRSSSEVLKWLQLKLTVLQYHNTTENSSCSTCQVCGTMGGCSGVLSIPGVVPGSYKGLVLQINSAGFLAAYYDSRAALSAHELTNTYSSALF